MNPSQQNWDAIKRQSQTNEDLVNSIHPTRDFGVADKPGFRTVEDFDAKFGLASRRA